jgi:hypothetical protein
VFENAGEEGYDSLESFAKSKMRRAEDYRTVYEPMFTDAINQIIRSTGGGGGVGGSFGNDSGIGGMDEQGGATTEHSYDQGEVYKRSNTGVEHGDARHGDVGGQERSLSPLSGEDDGELSDHSDHSSMHSSMTVDVSGLNVVEHHHHHHLSHHGHHSSQELQQHSLSEHGVSEQYGLPHAGRHDQDDSQYAGRHDGPQYGGGGVEQRAIGNRDPGHKLR